MDNLILKHRQFVQSQICKSFNTDIEKAKSGVYADTAENRKLGRVGQQYGSEKREDKRETKTANNLIKILHSVDEDYNNEKLVKVKQTPKGNWEIYYNEHRLGIVKGSMLDGKELKKLGVLSKKAGMDEEPKYKLPKGVSEKKFIEACVLAINNEECEIPSKDIYRFYNENEKYYKKYLNSKGYEDLDEMWNDSEIDDEEKENIFRNSLKKIPIQNILKEFKHNNDVKRILSNSKELRRREEYGFDFD